MQAWFGWDCTQARTKPNTVQALVFNVSGASQSSDVSANSWDHSGLHILIYWKLKLISAFPAGPTVVIDQRFDNESGASHPSDPGRSVLVWPRANTFAVFDGGLAHGVLDSASQEARVTLLVNWWTRQPQVMST